jgi:transcriptional antiterminator Rof (Rho-off)
MAQLTHAQYDALELAVAHRQRIVVYRRGTEYVVVPLELHVRDGREAIDARNPVTGDSMTLYLDEIETFEVVR